MLSNDERILQQAIPAAQNERSRKRSEDIIEIIFGVPKICLSADSNNEARINKLKYPFILLNSIAGIVSLPFYMLTL